MRKRLLDILCCVAILLLVAYQGILVAIMWSVVALAGHASEAGDWLGKYRANEIRRGN